jgi:hypothetical protein
MYRLRNADFARARSKSVWQWRAWGNAPDSGVCWGVAPGTRYVYFECALVFGQRLNPLSRATDSTHWRQMRREWWHLLSAVA